MTKKGIQVAFAITLIIISIIATIWQTELLGNIIYAVVVPSFLLSIISFVAEIADKCISSAAEVGDLAYESGNLSNQLTEIKMQDYDKGMSEMPYVEGVVPKDIKDQQEKTIEYYQDASAYKDVQIFFLKCQRICRNISIVGYVLLFLSLILSPYAVKLLAVVDLNCITLWSLTILYSTVELKNDICSKLVIGLQKRYLKKNKKELENQK